MAKRRRQQGCRCNCGGGKRPRKHLYLVLDDWEKGFSVHKLDALSLFDYDSASDNDEDGSGGGLKRLPDPPAVRITEARHSPMLFAGLGSCIFVANKRQYSAHASGALVYDTETAAMSMGPRLPENPCCLFVAAPAAGGETKKNKKPKREQETAVLYTLSTVKHGGGSQHPSRHVLGVSVHALSAPSLAAAEWSWETVPAPLAPFDGNEETVIAYAVHPDGCTIFLSTRDKTWRGGGTYSFHTERREWRSHGEWKLPFRQEVYFERELDAWVGLDEDGYVCACEAVAVGTDVAPAWKKTGQKLFRMGDPERHLGATLTYMGDNAFCLVESVMREDVSLRHAYVYGDGHGCALHVTVFGLKYSREGELQATLRRATSSYEVCKYIPGFSHVPFWM
uniref:Uncharacterized protein n=1 Tax=Avena sativa TaxID=4498 RepID=A0ACD5W5B2_AVESA